MAWNIRLLRRQQAHPLPSAEPPAPASPAEISPAELSPVTQEQLLAIFTRLAAILRLTAHIAVRLDKFDHHAALAARLAILKARVHAGENSQPLAAALTEFGQEFKEFITGELLRRPR